MPRERVMKAPLLVVHTYVVLVILLCPLRAEDKETNKPTYSESEKVLAPSRCEQGTCVIAPPDMTIAPFAMPSDTVDGSGPAERNAPPSTISSSPLPVVRSSDAPNSSVQWTSLMKGSMSYLWVMHSFRIATEAGTRDALNNSVVGGYFKALGAMHGWSDGDGYYENYLGHPIEGAV